jgi:hypothetical protein
MSLEGPLDKFLEDANREPGDHYVNITIYHFSTSLINEFMERIVKPNYPGGISPAIKDLMRKAVEEQKQREKKE